MNDPVQAHYRAFLAERYSWMSGGREEQVRKNREFFRIHALTPREGRVAIDLGAGCGFQSIPLAQAGYSVTAVDFCQSLLDELRVHAGDLPVVTVQSDIRAYSSWAGRHPALVVCMGDTLTHLPGIPEVEDLLRQCFSELAPDGRLVLTLRDYSREPDGAVIVIPVQREANRIFLCRLEYHRDSLTVQDILYSTGCRGWERTAGEYMKIRIAPETLTGMLTGTGFRIEYSAIHDDIITVIAGKGT